MNARVAQLHKTEAEWSKHNDWVPEAGELIVYDPDLRYDYARLKVGDGEKTLQELAFFVDSAIANTLQKCKYFEILDGGRVTDFIE